VTIVTVQSRGDLCLSHPMGFPQNYFSGTKYSTLCHVHVSCLVSVAATMLRRPEPIKARVEPTTLPATAIIEFSPLDQVDATTAATKSTLTLANHMSPIKSLGKGTPNSSTKGTMKIG